MEEGDHLTMLNVYEAFIKVSTAPTQKAPQPTQGGLGVRLPEGPFIKEWPRDLSIFLLDDCQCFQSMGVAPVWVFGVILPGRTQELLLAVPCLEM